MADSVKQTALPVAAKFGVCCRDDEGFQCSLAEPVNHVKGTNYLIVTIICRYCILRIFCGLEKSQN